MTKHQIKCPIWDTDATQVGLRDYADKQTIESPRAGGQYEITGTANAMLETLSLRQKILLTQEIIENLAASSTLRITSETIRHINDKQIPNPSERAEWLLRYFVRQSTTIGKVFEFRLSVNIRDSESVTIIGTKVSPEDLWPLFAWSASSQLEEIDFLLKYLQRLEYVDLGSGGPLPSVVVRPEGFASVTESESRGPFASQVFVAMWFTPSLDQAYENGIERALRESGYEPLRIDRVEHVNKIDDEIIAAIRRSHFLVADFTCGVVEQKGTKIGVARGGVYYEAGFAQGLGIPVIWSCKADAIDLVHFDTRQFNHIVWTDPDDLYKKLKDRIGAVIGNGPLFRSD